MDRAKSTAHHTCTYRTIDLASGSQSAVDIEVWKMSVKEVKSRGRFPEFGLGMLLNNAKWVLNVHCEYGHSGNHSFLTQE